MIIFFSLVKLKGMQTIQIRVRLNQEDVETLQRLSESTSLAQIDLATMFLHAALRTIAKNKCRFQFPPDFELAEHQNQGPPRK